jgi:uncharacterized protein (TIGR02996 family)
MNVGDALLEDVLEHPDDDGPRLVYADWLDEHGDPERAEFIRLQCELARLDEDDPRRQKLFAREWEILHNGQPKVGWSGGLPAGALAFASERQYRRGFVEEVAVTVPAFLEGAGELFRRMPLRVVRFREATPAVAPALAACPWLARLAGIDLSWNALGDEGLAALLASPHLEGLRSLSLRGSGLSAEGVQALAAAPQLARLTALDLGTSGRSWTPPGVIGRRGARALAASPYLRHLESLSLGGMPEYWGGHDIATAGCRALARSAILDSMTALDLSCNAIDDGGARALAASPHAGRLRRLDLCGNALTPAGVEALIDSPSLGNLKVLGLSSNPGGPQVQFYYDWDGSCVHSSSDDAAFERLARRFRQKVRIT